MKRNRHTPEQIIRMLREADGRLAEGKTIAELGQRLEISEPTFHCGRNQYGGWGQRIRAAEALSRGDRITTTRKLNLSGTAEAPVRKREVNRPTFGRCACGPSVGRVELLCDGLRFTATESRLTTSNSYA